GRSPDAATSRPSCREPRNPRIRTPRTRTGSHAENPRANRADHPRPQTRCASPSTATSTQGPTGKDRCLASPHDRLDPNQSLPTQTQKAALPTQFSEEPRSPGIRKHVIVQWLASFADDYISNRNVIQF